MGKVYEENYKGYKIKIFYDDACDDDFFNVFDIFGYHKRYNKLFSIENNYRLGNYELDFKQYLKDNGLTLNDVIYSPVSLYEHGGITLNLGGNTCRWDSGQLGIMFITKEKARKEHGFKLITKKREKYILEAMREQLQYMTDLCNGNTYMFVIENEYYEEVDRFWGYVGNYEDNCLICARDEVDVLVKQDEKDKDKDKVFLISVGFDIKIEAKNKDEAIAKTKEKMITNANSILDFENPARVNVYSVEKGGE